MMLHFLTHCHQYFVFVHRLCHTVKMDDLKHEAKDKAKWGLG